MSTAIVDFFADIGTWISDNPLIIYAIVAIGYVIGISWYTLSNLSAQGNYTGTLDNVYTNARSHCIMWMLLMIFIVISIVVAFTVLEDYNHFMVVLIPILLISIINFLDNIVTLLSLTAANKTRIFFNTVLFIIICVVCVGFAKYTNDY
uniref:Uncharacterized protein n=1 Tax=viral metagenome TaxID=1070528 RepID=A0A6C0HKU8_9ZZZZ